MVRPVAVRQPVIRWGRYWIFFSLRLTDTNQVIKTAGGEVGNGALEQRPDALTGVELRCVGRHPVDAQPPLTPLLLGGRIPATLPIPHAPVIRQQPASVTTRSLRVH